MENENENKGCGILGTCVLLDVLQFLYMWLIHFDGSLSKACDVMATPLSVGLHLFVYVGLWLLVINTQHK